MALRRMNNGQFEVKTKAQAVEALNTMRELTDAVAELKKENGIDEMETDAVELKKAATRYMEEKGLQTLEISDDRVAKLIQATRSEWIGDDDDLKRIGRVQGAVTLKEITSEIQVERKGKKAISLWNFLTKRVPVPEKIDEAVKRGYITEEQIAPALVEKPNAPYVRVFDE